MNRAYIEITNVCNGSCSFCPGTGRAPDFMSYESFDRVTASVAEFVDLVYLHVLGEPLLHPSLGEFIRLAKSRGLRVGITTNGKLLPECTEMLLREKPYKIQVSVHSFESGSDGEFLRYLHGCFDFAKKASEAGILVVLRLWNRGYDSGRNLDTLAVLREKIGEDFILTDKGARISPKLHLEFGDRFAWPSLSSADLGERVFCHGMTDQFAVLVDGTVCPCCLDSEGDVNLGNIFDTPLWQILNSPRAEAMRQGFRKHKATEELCRKCPYARRFKI